MFDIAPHATVLLGRATVRWLANYQPRLPNLRRLAERFGNPLPEDRVARYIDGRAAVKAHGPRDMPVWGVRFHYESGADERREWIGDLVAYLQSIQTPIRNASLK